MTEPTEDDVKVRCMICDGDKVLWSSTAPDVESVGRAIWEAVRVCDVAGYERELGTEWGGELVMKSSVMVKDVDGEGGYYLFR